MSPMGELQVRGIFEGEYVLEGADALVIAQMDTKAAGLKVGDYVQIRGDFLRKKKSLSMWEMAHRVDRLFSPEVSTGHGYVVSIHGDVVVNDMGNGKSLAFFSNIDAAFRFWKFYFGESGHTLTVTRYDKAKEFCDKNKIGVLIDFDVDTGHGISIDVANMDKFGIVWAARKMQIINALTQNALEGV